MVEPSVRSVYELLERQYGVKLDFEENPVTASVGVTDAVILKNNPRRIALVIINLSANTVYIRPGVLAASATAGIVLIPSGGSVTLNCQEDFHLPALEWHAVASGAASAIYIAGIIII